jgi:hypothetical protein
MGDMETVVIDDEHEETERHDTEADDADPLIDRRFIL